MITRVPVSISMGTRGTRELLMSLLVEALLPPRLSRVCACHAFEYIFEGREGKQNGGRCIQRLLLLENTEGARGGQTGLWAS